MRVTINENQYEWASLLEPNTDISVPVKPQDRYTVWKALLTID